MCRRSQRCDVPLRSCIRDQHWNHEALIDSASVVLKEDEAMQVEGRDWSEKEALGSRLSAGQL